MSGRSGGVVYTPERWAGWAVGNFGIHRRWMNGETVLDPGCGRGALLLAVITRAIDEGFRPTDSDLARLKGIDIDGEALRILDGELRRILERSLPEGCLIHGDFLDGRDESRDRFDIVLANPPWLTFADLDNDRKERYKPLFRKSGLVSNPRGLLLGGSRIDLSALFVLKAVGDQLAEGGDGYFFLPLSLFRNESTHRDFRLALDSSGEAGSVATERQAAIQEIWDLTDARPFPGVGTKYGFVHYRKGERQAWPIPWKQVESDDTWNHREARPVDGAGSPLIHMQPGEIPPPVPKIPVPEGTLPRQGANTGGAAEVYIFDERTDVDGHLSLVRNRKGVETLLPGALLHPLMTGETFNESSKPIPRRWIFLPYNQNGRLMTQEEIENFPEAAEWLERNRRLLERRKGRLLAGWREKGRWWAMHGVGSYTFSRWKVAWEAYGRKEFRPVLLTGGDWGLWQGNQALHAYLPFVDRQAAEDCLRALKSADVQQYLLSLGGQGTKVWAQPGRIRRLLRSVSGPETTPGDMGDRRTR